MRYDEIIRLKVHQSANIPALNPIDVTDEMEQASPFVLRESDPRFSGVKRFCAPAFLSLTQSKVKASVDCELPSWVTHFGIEDRFMYDAALASVLRLNPDLSTKTVLVGGCFVGGEDVQFWLRRKIQKCYGIDLNCLDKVWSRCLPVLREYYGVDVEFKLSALEEIQLPDNSVDIITTSATLEHVSNVEKMVQETARVMRPGGLAIHSFGPLYHVFGGDHCIAAYGEEYGYDHILLSEESYRERITNQSFFDKQADPNLPFWALNNQFSFLTTNEYHKYFTEYFDIAYSNAVISQAALRYRAQHPDQWSKLLSLGIKEEDLLIKSLNLVVRLKG